MLNRTRAKASEATALGVTITGTCSLLLSMLAPALGLRHSVDCVPAAPQHNPISGTFSNLSDGSVFTSNGNNFQVGYAGGTGNDLTLTVVP